MRKVSDESVWYFFLSKFRKTRGIHESKQKEKYRTVNIMEPLNQIEAAAKHLREGKLGYANDIDYESEDEFGKLAKSLSESINILDGYVKNICENFTMVANGDLTRDVKDIPDYLGDFMSLKERFGIILKEYNSTLNQIKGVSGQVDSGSEEVASAANDLASGTSEQASAVEEMNATIETVSSIAEETAVVADQIGKLATDSANTVVNTKELIKNTLEEIGKGSVITEKTAEGFIRIIKELENFAEITRTNSEKSKMQSEALLQVGEAIEQISLITQQNAASSEECSAISEEMAARATELDNLVNKFKLY